MFGIYKGKCYDYVYFRKHYELITEHAEKAFDEFTQRSDLYIKATDENDPDLTDIYDIELWLNHDTGIAGLPLVWGVSLDGFTVIKDGKISIDYHGPIEDTTNWKRIDKAIWQTFINLSDINGAYILYKYKKKDGVIYEESLVVREDISVEKLIELRKFYGCEGKL